MPVFSNVNGDESVVLVERPDGSRAFVRAGLEDGVCTDCGPEFGPVILDVLVEAFENRGWSKDELNDASVRLGFSESSALFGELTATERRTFAEQEAFLARLRRQFFP